MISSNLKKVFRLDEKKQRFALDIGTRTVVGIILEEVKNKKVIKKLYLKNIPNGPCLMDKYMMFLL
jgi:hypothetical protein